MKRFLTINILTGALLGTTLLVGTALANPALLPEHPGHPMKPLKSPVTGQSLANDPGRDLWTGEKAMQAATKSEIRKNPEWTEKDTNVNNKGAGVLPELAKGYPDYEINPPVKNAINPNR
ncbi:hypothetical protein [Candidatus Nitronereus thalassa]|uniref:Uncharacterized protein n=1 Tax=Candidatus Nitronereus thalassa TaxID=3020898 RepID=A0ABU3KC35_9BACT|nr:hypothetical protein [Candidatus Nitronereus thalassa]MDT7043737.1 hypothetical protein [Candidatus Nitronereus thalassa]